MRFGMGSCGTVAVLAILGVGSFAGGQEVVYSFPLDESPQWLATGDILVKGGGGSTEWEFGPPMGGGSYNQNPTAAVTGSNVYGTNLDGNFLDSSFDEDTLTTTALDFSNYYDVRVRFWRWIGVNTNNQDDARVEVSNDGTLFHTVWENPQVAIEQTAWEQVEYDLSNVADQQSDVYLRWSIGPIFGDFRPGWNIDDIEFIGTPVLDEAIPDDNGSTVLEIPLEIDEPWLIGDVNVNVKIIHPDRGELIVELVSPSNTPVTLHNGSGSGNPNLDIVYDSDESIFVDGPGALTDVDGEPAAGTWLLRVTDTAAGNAGTVEQFSLELTEQTGTLEGSVSVSSETIGHPEFTDITIHVYDLTSNSNEPVQSAFFDDESMVEYAFDLPPSGYLLMIRATDGCEGGTKVLVASVQAGQVTMLSNVEVEGPPNGKGCGSLVPPYVLGVVKDSVTGDPISGAMVFVNDTPYDAASDGLYQVLLGDADNNQIYALAEGYATSDTENFDVTNSPERMDISLQPLSLGVTLSTTATTPTNASPFSFTATFDGNVTGFTVGDVAVTNGVASNLQGSGSVYTFDVTPASEGAVEVSIPANSAMSASSSAQNTASNDVTITYDTSPPTAVMNSDAPELTNMAVPVTLTLSEAPVGLALGDLQLTNGTVAALDGSGTSYTFTLTPQSDGEVTATLPGGSFTDAAGNGSLIDASISRIFDSTAPTVTMFEPLDPGPTTAETATFAIEFSENVMGVTMDDFMFVQVSGDVSGTIGGMVTGALDAYGVMVEGISGTGTFRVDLSASSGIADAAGNPLAGGAQGGAVVVDVGEPVGVTLSSTVSDPTNGAFTVVATFSESVTGFAVGDVTVTNGAASGLTGSGGVYSFTVTPTLDGEVSIQIPATVVTGTSGGGNTASNTLRRTFDGTAPTVASFAVTPAGTVTETEATFALTFSEAVSGVTSGQFSFVSVSGGVSGSIGTPVNGSGTSYMVPVENLSGSGQFAVSFAPGGAVRDTAGNAAAAAQSTAAEFVEAVPVTTTLSSTSSNPTNGPFVVTAVFGASVTGFALDDVTVTNGTATGLAGSGAQYTFTVTAAAEGDVTVQVPAGRVQDGMGNGNLESNLLSRTVDTTAPTITSFAPVDSPIVASTTTVSLAFSEVVTGVAAGQFSFDATDGSVSGAIGGTVSGGGANYTVPIVNLSGTGTFVVRFSPAGAVADGAGNAFASTAESDEGEFVGTRVTVSLTTTAANPLNAGPIPVTATFSRDVTGFELSDLTVVNATASGLAGSGAVYTFNLAPTGDGLVSVRVPADAVMDGGGESNAASNLLSRTFDGTAPVVESITPREPSQTNAVTMVYDVEFSEAVTGVTAGAFALNTVSGTVAGTLDGVTGSGATYEVSVTGITGDGELAVDLTTIAGIADGAGNGLAATFAGTDLLFDHTAPGVTLSADVSGTVTSPFVTITVTATESITNLAVEDFTVTNGTATNLDGFGATYTVTLGAAAEGAFSIQLPAGMVEDASGNGNTASNSLGFAYMMVPEPTACEAAELIEAELTEFVTDFGVGTDDMDADGLPEAVALALFVQVACGVEQDSLALAVEAAYQLNLAALDAEGDAAVFAKYRHGMAALAALNSTMVAALNTAMTGVAVMTGEYAVIECDLGNLCSPQEEKGTASERIFSITPKGPDTVEPFSGEGDLDGDMVTNAQEYANVIATGGTLDDFLMAAFDATTDGMLEEMGCFGGSERRGGFGTSGDVLLLGLFALTLAAWRRRTV